MFRKSTDNGMLVLYEPEVDSSQVSYDVILVHGARGHRTRSFTHQNGVCWPKDLLPLNKSDIRVMSWGWDSKGIRYGTMSANSLEDHALALLADIAVYRPEQLDQRPMIFIAHSIGGNIVKEALLTSTHQAVKFELCYGSIIFLGTPHHHGLRLVTCFRLYRHLPGFYADPWTKQLREDSDWLEKQTKRFNENDRLCDLRSWSFYETISINVPFYKKIVVDQNSATLGQSEEIVRPLDSDHFNLGRFPNENDANYLRVQDAISSWNRWMESKQGEIRDPVFSHHSTENHEPAADSTLNLHDAAPTISVVIHHTQVESLLEAAIDIDSTKNKIIYSTLAKHNLTAEISTTEDSEHIRRSIDLKFSILGKSKVHSRTFIVENHLKSSTNLTHDHSTPAASVNLLSTSKTPPLYHHTDDKVIESLRSENSQVLQASKELGKISLDPPKSITDIQSLKVKSFTSPSSISLPQGSMKAWSDKISGQSSHLTTAEGIAIGASSIAGVNLLTSIASAYTSRQALEQSRISTKASAWSANISAATYAMNKDKIERDEQRNQELTSSSSKKITTTQPQSIDMTVATSLAKIANHAPPEIIFPSVPKNEPIRRDSRDSNDDGDGPTGTFAYTNDGTAILQTNGQDAYSMRTMDSSKEYAHISKTTNTKHDNSSSAHSSISIYLDSQDTAPVPHVEIPPSTRSSSKFKPPSASSPGIAAEKTQSSSPQQESQVIASTAPKHTSTGKESISSGIAHTSGPTLTQDEIKVPRPTRTEAKSNRERGRRESVCMYVCVRVLLKNKQEKLGVTTMYSSGFDLLFFLL
ncbi:hypothetical protein EYC84_007933 [Monilinia fructicola]|uniref:DUF676 domain-containing protein n=1 Tax=Monilinia fructicola TaxID=38448 RepID=A0A5M9JLT3_MONFR|nr:hypothetical protein EYC84_007933 [Monilinia fructicola]